VNLQRLSNPEDSLFFSIVGWHALTLPQNPAMLRQSKMDMLATLLAIGIDPKRSVIFHQDDVGFLVFLFRSSVLFIHFLSRGGLESVPY